MAKGGEAEAGITDHSSQASSSQSVANKMEDWEHYITSNSVDMLGNDYMKAYKVSIIGEWL